MFKKHSITFSLFAGSLFYSSCINNPQTKTDDFEAVNVNLTISNQKIKKGNDSLYKVLEKKLQDEKASQSARYWFPRAKHFQKWTSEIYENIELVAYELRTNSVSYNGDSLYALLELYKSRILRVDPEISEAIYNNTKNITHYFDSVKLHQFENLNSLFLNKSKEELLFILNQSLNNIETVEHETLSFCLNKIN